MKDKNDRKPQFVYGQRLRFLVTFFHCVILYTERPVQHSDAGGGYAGICPVSAEIIQKGKDVWSSFKRTTRNMIEKYTGFF